MTTVAADRGRPSLAPALLAAAALHLGLLLLLILADRPGEAGLGTAVPITLVARGPTTDSRPAEAAPETQSAQTETPAQTANAPTPAPPPPPRPAPPQPARPIPPAPKATPLPSKPPPKATPTRSDRPDTFSLDALAASIARTNRHAPARPGAAPRGPARAETAPQARVDAGQGVSQSDIAGLAELLQRLWNPNCDVEGGDKVIVSMRLAIDGEGRVASLTAVGAAASSADPVEATATRRARDAIRQAEPFAAPFRGQTFPVNFDARKACAQR